MDILISVGRDADPGNYIQAVEGAGGRPFAAYLPAETDFDGLILAGGGDIHPSLFGQKNCGSRDVDFARDRAELALLEAFAAAGKPVLGICRGHQLVNVWAGGGIIQDLGEHNAVHRREGSDKIHLVMARSGLLRALYGPRFWANSAHHQGVGPVGKGLQVTARAADGVIEAMEHDRLPIFTTQFHPERMVGSDTAPGEALFRRFLALTAKAYPDCSPHRMEPAKPTGVRAGVLSVEGKH